MLRIAVTVGALGLVACSSSRDDAKPSGTAFTEHVPKEITKTPNRASAPRRSGLRSTTGGRDLTP